MKSADLHLHTLFSDGTFTARQIVMEARDSGLCAISITDHDTVEAIAPAIEEAGKVDVEVLSGVELSAEYDGIEIHMLGYLIDYENKALLEKLEFLKNVRVERIYKITEKLKGLGISLDAAKVFAVSVLGTVGRLHVARAMVKEGIVSSIYEAFAKYIGDKGPAYVANFRLTPQEAIKIIKEAKGIPVLAHPYCLNRDDLIPMFADMGLMGLEVYYPEHTQSMINYYLGIAKNFKLLVTGGSDFHGDAKPDVKMGVFKVPYELVEKLKQVQK